MDAIFLLGEAARTQFLQTFSKALRCTYISLWSYHPISSTDLSSHLHSIDGWYNEENHQQPISSSRSLGRRLFDTYRQTPCSIENGYVPGLACKEGISYLELTEVELMRRASAETQRQFYQEARIKIAVFLGCKLGEIEIGLPTSSPANMEMEMRNWFPCDFLHHQNSLQLRELPPPPDQNWPSSSSSSLRLVSVGSPDQYSPLLFNMPGTSYMSAESLQEAQIEQAIRPTSTTLALHQQTIQAYHRLGGVHFLNLESDDAEITKAMLAVISSPSSSSSSYQPQAVVPQEMQMEMRNWFSSDFLHHQNSLQFRELPPPTDQNWPSSSSSSLTLLSVGSPNQYSPLLFNMPAESLKEAQIEQPIRPTSTTLPQHQQTIQAYHRLGGIPLLNPESDDAEMTKAMLAVISSPSSPSSSYQPQIVMPQERSAFKQYTKSSPARNIQIKAIPPRQNMMKHAFALLRSLNQRRIQKQLMAAAVGSRPPPTTSQLYHKISERKRREKLNETFEELRLQLPPCSKRDKASLLKHTTEYLNKLNLEISDLKKKNQQLETRISCARGGSTSSNSEEACGGSPSRRIDVQIGRASESTSEEQEVELRVTVRGDCDTVALVICILESLKQVENANLVFMEADTELSQQASTSIHRVILRLKIKGNEWDESAFKETITRAVSDLAQ